MKIERRNYSRSPWRLIDNNDREVVWQRPMKHPDLGQTWVTEAVCGETKAECTARVLELLGLCFARLNAGYAVNPASALPNSDKLISAANYIDKLGGDSKPYRVHAAANPMQADA
jgi:hypothetical protein